jgi:hypothetical protein
MEESQLAVIEQTTVALPFLHDEVPALCLSNGRLYIPVYAVCHALGIRADVHIRRWQRLVVWINARKLSLQTEKLGKRLVWCLPIAEVPFLNGLFNWQLVSPERRLQLYQATQEQAKRSNLAYQFMQQQYKAMRQALFTFLIRFADMDLLFQHYAEILAFTNDDESSLVLASLIEFGRSLFQKASKLASKMLFEQDDLLIIDTFKVDSSNNVVDSFSMPLLPVVSYQDSELFFALLAQLTAWKQELQTFWSDRGV